MTNRIGVANKAKYLWCTLILLLAGLTGIAQVAMAKTTTVLAIPDNYMMQRSDKLDEFVVPAAGTEDVTKYRNGKYVDFGGVDARYPAGKSCGEDTDCLKANRDRGFSAPAGSTWELIFSDEFDGPNLDLQIWEPSWFGGNGISKPVNSAEDACYDPSNLKVMNGNLEITVDRTSDPSCVTRSGSRAWYSAGHINTRETFTFAHGYIEARMYLPGSNGNLHNWPAFWTDGTGTWPITGEIDIMEGLETHKPCWHYHYESGGSHKSNGECLDLSPNSGWHVFAAKWEPGKITFYYDGRDVGTQTIGVVDDEHFIIINYTINDSYGITVPSTMLVDYVRVWKTAPSSNPAAPQNLTIQ